MKADEIILIAVVLTFCAVVIIQTIMAGGHPPAWFEANVVPFTIALLLTIKKGVEEGKKIFYIRMEKDKDETSSTD